MNQQNQHAKVKQQKQQAATSNGVCVGNNLHSVNTLLGKARAALDAKLNAAVTYGTRRLHAQLEPPSASFKFDLALAGRNAFACSRGGDNGGNDGGSNVAWRLAANGVVRFETGEHEA